MKFYIISGTVSEFDDKKGLAAHLYAHALAAGQRVVEGEEVDVAPEIKITRKSTNGAPATKRSPTDATTREAFDAKVLGLLRVAHPGPLTVDGIAKLCAVPNVEVSPALARLVKAGTVRKVKHATYAAVAKEASAS